MAASLLSRRNLDALAILHKLRPVAAVARPCTTGASDQVEEKSNGRDAFDRVEERPSGQLGAIERIEGFIRRCNGYDQLEPMSSRHGDAIYVDDRPGAAEIGIQVNPFFPAWNMRDKMVEDGPFGAAVAERVASCPRRDFEERVDDAGLYIRVDMPGLGKENVEVWVEDQDSVVFRGGGPEENGRRYGGRIHLQTKLFKMEEIKVEMKNGVLKIAVPKVAGAERANICRKLNIE